MDVIQECTEIKASMASLEELRMIARGLKTDIAEIENQNLPKARKNELIELKYDKLDSIRIEMKELEAASCPFRAKCCRFSISSLPSDKQRKHHEWKHVTGCKAGETAWLATTTICPYKHSFEA